tara:strand:+ start:258 stop:458 length:201 start_codon:yes stop_codon:yes gene_type:complete
MLNIKNSLDKLFSHLVNDTKKESDNTKEAIALLNFMIESDIYNKQKTVSTKGLKGVFKSIVKTLEK